MKKKTIYMLGTAFYAGASPVAPGTVGSIAACLALILIDLAVGGLAWWIPFAMGGVAFFASLPIASAAAREWEDKDPSWFVLDEVAAVWLTCGGLVALDDTIPHYVVYLMALATFRVFDIAKPRPIKDVERAYGPAGIMLDDVVAALYAWCLTAVILVAQS